MTKQEKTFKKKLKQEEEVLDEFDEDADWFDEEIDEAYRRTRDTMEDMENYEDKSKIDYSKIFKQFEELVKKIKTSSMKQKNQIIKLRDEVKSLKQDKLNGIEVLKMNTGFLKDMKTHLIEIHSKIQKFSKEINQKNKLFGNLVGFILKIIQKINSKLLKDKKTSLKNLDGLRTTGSKFEEFYKSSKKLAENLVDHLRVVLVKEKERGSSIADDNLKLAQEINQLRFDLSTQQQNYNQENNSVQETIQNKLVNLEVKKIEDEIQNELN